MELALRQVQLEEQHTNIVLDLRFQTDDRRLLEIPLLKPEILVSYHNHDTQQTSVRLQDDGFPVYVFPISPEEIDGIYAFLENERLYPRLRWRRAWGRKSDHKKKK